jgi:hypothetical protein
MRHLAPKQVRLLECEYCFHVPSGTVVDEFMRQYFCYVHPLFPLLNERQFWTTYSSSGRDRRLTYGFSLALFQAMLFAASRVG